MCLAIHVFAIQAGGHLIAASSTYILQLATLDITKLVWGPQAGDQK
jgi:hypothetical protein